MQKKYIDIRKAKGLCVTCGDYPVSDGTTRCKSCREAASLYARKRYRTAKANSLCRQCLVPVSDGQAKCGTCREGRKKERRKIKDAVFAAYGGYVCACCGVAEPMFLQVDHIHRDGQALRKEQGLGSSLYRWLRMRGFPAGYQILCANCNHARSRHDNPSGTCPHEFARQSLTEVTSANQAA